MERRVRQEGGMMPIDSEGRDTAEPKFIFTAPQLANLVGRDIAASVIGALFVHQHGSFAAAARAVWPFLVPAAARCALCAYQHGHAIGCDNNPVDIALRDRRPADTCAASAAAKGVTDTERLDWLLSHPNEVLEDAGDEWFILDEESEPTYFKSGREAIDAALAARAATAPNAPTP
jgi:hypothetical protein